LQLAPEFLKGTVLPLTSPPTASTGTNAPSSPAPTARQRAATLGHASPRGNAFFAALDADAVVAAPRPRLKTPSLDFKHHPAHHPDRRRGHSTSDVPPTPTLPSLLLLRHTPTLSAPEPTLPPTPPPHAEPRLRQRGKSLLQLRTKGSKASLRATAPAPASAPPQVPVYKWSALAVAPLEAAIPKQHHQQQLQQHQHQHQQQHRAGLKGLFRRPASRSASEPPPYCPPVPPVSKARPNSEGVRMHAAPFEIEVEPAEEGEREKERERERAFEAQVQQQQRQLRKMPSARDLFRKRRQ
jgi:hypothetical protein